MKPVLITIIAILAVVIVIAMFDFNVTDSGSLPDVSVSGGEMPNAEVRGPDVQVNTEERSIEVPTDVEVQTETKTFDVPSDVEFDLPEDRESEALTNE